MEEREGNKEYNNILIKMKNRGKGGLTSLHVGYLNHKPHLGVPVSSFHPDSSRLIFEVTF